MATSLTVTQIQINVPTSPLEGKFDFQSGRFLTDKSDGDDRMELDGEEQEQQAALALTTTVIDRVFQSIPPTPGASTPGATTPLHPQFEFTRALHNELENFKGGADAFHSGLSQYNNFHDSDEMEIDSDASSNFGGSTLGSSAVSTVPSSPGVFNDGKAGHLRVATDLMMVDSGNGMPDTPIIDVSGFGTVIRINGTPFSVQDAHHLRYLLHAARDLTNETVGKFIQAVLRQEEWSQLEIINRTTPFLVLANYEASRDDGDKELANGLRAFHRLYMAKPSPQAMAKAVRQVRGCRSAADVDQGTSVALAEMPLADVRTTLYGLLMESSGTDYSDVPLSPSLEGQMSLISGNAESCEYQYPEGCFLSEDHFLAHLGRDNLNRQDSPTAILAWLMLAQLNFSSKSWSMEFSQYLSQSPAYVQARASVLAEMYRVTKDLVSQNMVFQSIDLNALWVNWVKEIPAPWKNNETWEWLAATPY